MVDFNDLTSSLDEQAAKTQDEQSKATQAKFIEDSSAQIIGELKSLNSVLLASPIAKDKKVASVATKLAGFIDQLDKSTGAIKGANFKPLADSLKGLDATLKNLPPQITEAHQAVDSRPHLEQLNSTLAGKNFSPVVKVAPPDLSGLSSLLSDIKQLLSKDADKIDLTKLEKLTSDVSSAVGGVKGSIEALRFPVSNFVLPFRNQAGKADQVQLSSTGAVPVSGSFSAGDKSNNAVAPGTNNLGVLPAIANAASPSYTEGNQIGLSTDLSGNLRVTGSLSVGGTTDNSAYTAGTSTGTPAMGFYHSTIDTVTDGRSATVAITSKRAQMVNLQTAAGVETGVPAAPLQVSLANTGANTSKLLVTPDANSSINNAQVAGTTTATGNGVVGAGVQRVAIASDNSAFSVNATLSAETTKVIGTVNVAASQTIAVTNTGTFATQATLAAETTKVIGTVNVAAGQTIATTNTGTFAVQNTPVTPTTIFDGKTSVTTAGTRVTLAASQAVKSVTIKALSTNTGIIYVGNASVASTNGLQLLAGESVNMDIANLNTVNLDCSVNGEGVTYLAVA